jgi:hypothetical protein
VREFEVGSKYVAGSIRPFIERFLKPKKGFSQKLRFVAIGLG